MKPTEKETKPLNNNWLETILSFNFKLLILLSLTFSLEINFHVNQISAEMTEKEITDKLTALHLQDHFQANQMLKQLKHSNTKYQEQKKSAEKSVNMNKIFFRFMRVLVTTFLNYF